MTFESTWWVLILMDGSRLQYLGLFTSTLKHKHKLTVCCLFTLLPQVKNAMSILIGWATGNRKDSPIGLHLLPLLNDLKHRKGTRLLTAYIYLWTVWCLPTTHLQPVYFLFTGLSFTPCLVCSLHVNRLFTVCLPWTYSQLEAVYSSFTDCLSLPRWSSSTAGPILLSRWSLWSAESSCPQTSWCRTGRQPCRDKLHHHAVQTQPVSHDWGI